MKSLFILTVLLLSPVAALRATEVGNLRCEYRENPLSIDVLTPRLSWKLETENSKTARGVAQSAYQLLVASTPALLAQDTGDLWDSGKIASDQSIQVEYAGKPLESRTHCFWKVRVWDQDGNKSAWSQTASWEMGLLNPSDWKGQWIADADSVQNSGNADNPSTDLKTNSWVWYPQENMAKLPPGTCCLRRKFKWEADVSRAVFHLSADNSFTLFVNGQATLSGTQWRELRKKNITQYLVPGENVIAILAVNEGTSPSPAGVIGWVDLSFSDGRQERVNVDESWKTKPTEEEGWKTAAFDDTAWTPAKTVTMYGGGEWGSGLNAVQGDGNRLPLFRKSFTVTKTVQRAELFISGQGCSEVHINGAVADDALFEPGWTLYSKTCLYRAYDLSSQIVAGENVLGVLLGNGMYNVEPGRYTKFQGSFGPPKLIAQLHLDYADGSSEVLGSDDTWLTAPGPITFSSVYGGEDYDARLEIPGWDKPGFVADRDWNPAAVTEGPGGKLRGSSQSAPPVKVMQVLPVATKTRLKPGVWVYDLGQNCSMLPKITVQGAAGSKITIQTGERFEDGHFVGACDGFMSFNYILKGGPTPETWSPRFCYTGARYLQIEGAEAAGETTNGTTPVVLAVEGLFVTSSAPPVGEFSCSNTLFNRTQQIIQWAIRSNLMSILTDCPHREKLGWLEQVHLMGPSLMYGYDLATLLTKMEGDMADSQLENGLMPDIAPEYVVFPGGFRDSPEWGSACVLVPWNLYQWYGDLAVLRRNYGVMQRYVAYLDSKAKDHILSQGLGDWVGLDSTSPESTGTAFYYLDLLVMEKTARLLGKTEEADLYTKQAAEVRTAYNAKLFKNGSYGSQTANALPLTMGMVEPAKVASVLDAIIADIRKRDNSLTSGDVGYRYLLRALANNGRSDVIFDMNSRSDKPGYGMILAKGNTSLTEPWDGSPRASSNHFMLGHIMEWFFADLAGIQSDPARPAFRRIIIKPQVVGDLTWVKCSYQSINGQIISNWKREADKLTMEVTIPANTTATVYVPTKDNAGVTESGQPAAQAVGVKFLQQQNDAAIYEIGSGSYHFACPNL